MRPLNFFYCDLKKTFEVNTNLLLEELFPYISDSLETGPYVKYKNLYANDMDITHTTDEKIIKGKLKGYSVLSLTETDLQYSTYGFNVLRKVMHNHEWKWKKNLNYTKQIVDSMPFKKYYIVKLITLPAGGIGVKHKDTEEFINHSITLEIFSKINKMKIYYENSEYETSSDYFIFDDRVLHGTGCVEHDRMVLRIHGELDLEKCENLYIRDSVLYF